MQSDFIDLCKDARGHIPIPAVPLGAIRSRAVPDAPRHRRAISAVVLASTSLLAVAVGAQVLGGTRFSFVPGGGLTMRFDERTVNIAPTNANLQAAVGQADFRVVLPAGLPQGSRLNDLARVGRSVLILGYSVPSAKGRRDDLRLWLVNAANVGALEKSAGNASTYRVDVRMTGRRSHWRAGAEEVIVASHGSLTPAQVSNVENAMLAAADSRTGR